MALRVPNHIIQQLSAILDICRAHHIMISTAESCTGGMIATYLTHLAGSSSMFDRALITYSNNAKWELLGVPNSTIKTHGAVSTETVEAMCYGLAQASRAQMLLSVSGVAGPASSENKPIGLVYGALQWRTTMHDEPSAPISKEFRFVGTRDDIREETTHVMIEWLHDFLQHKTL